MEAEMRRRVRAGLGKAEAAADAAADLLRNTDIRGTRPHHLSNSLRLLSSRFRAKAAGPTLRRFH